MLTFKSVVQELFEIAGIKVDGPNPWDIRVHDDRFYQRALNESNLGLGESYMDGWWDCPRPDEFFFRILTAQLHEKTRRNLKTFLTVIRAHLFNLQSVRRVFQVARAHYNLDNELFFSFLDPHLQYSCAYFRDTEDLSEAQIRKLDLIVSKLDLKPSDHLLDIGFGWGGLAKYVASKVGCEVTGVNISTEQISFAKGHCAGLPIKMIHSDYRQIQGSFDKIVSVGMFEHVGSKNYLAYMDVINRVLKPDGIFLLHTIGSNESSMMTDPWIDKYIFPNGLLPSPAQIGKAIEKRLVIEDWHNFGPYYDKTLLCWNERFQRAWPQLAKKYDERTKRMWEYYLLSCAGVFRSRHNQLWQIVLTRTGRQQPFCRFS
jgi:cyclopropane-fatty-acyl-phospholipid synthase